MKNRKSPRWANWDYSNEGYYFVTICTKDRIHYFGEIDHSDDNNVDVGNENRRLREQACLFHTTG